MARRELCLKSQDSFKGSVSPKTESSLLKAVQVEPKENTFSLKHMHRSLFFLFLSLHAVQNYDKILQSNTQLPKTRHYQLQITPLSLPRI